MYKRIFLMLMIVGGTGCSGERVMYRQQQNAEVAPVELTANVNTYFSICNNGGFEALSEKNVDSYALVDFGVPGFSEATVKSAKVGLPVDKSIIVSAGMRLPRMECVVAYITKLEVDKRYRVDATLNERAKKCYVDLYEIGADNNETRVSENWVKNYTPCNQFVSDENALSRNAQFRKDAR